MSTWVRRQFGSVGITQSPPGPHLAALQGRFGGTVMLMIDVSGSMNGKPILQAAKGARKFVKEAVAARYKVGVMLWDTIVEEVCTPTKDGAAAMEILSRLNMATGGNALDGPLAACHRMFEGITGDRVVALFGDGDLSPKAAVLAKVAEMKVDNIRFVTRGLGEYAAREFGEISDEEPGTAHVESVDQLASGIASMAASLNSSSSALGRRS